MPPPLPACDVFTTSELTTLGWTRPALRNAVVTGRIVRVRHGVYASVPLTPEVRAIAAGRAYPQATISHCSALLLRNLPVLGVAPPDPQLTVAPRSSVTMPGTHVHRATLNPLDRMAMQGAAITSVARTLVDVARSTTLEAGVVAIDAARHHGLVTVDDIARVMEECPNWPGIRRAHSALTSSDNRAESPLESLSRLAFPSLGLPTPRSQVDMFDETGVFIGRCDFYWDELGVVGEADGLLKYRDPSDPDALVREKLRQDAFERVGLAVARWGWTQARSDHIELRRRVLRAFEQAAARDRLGLPRRWAVDRRC